MTEILDNRKAKVLAFAGFFYPHVGGSETVMRDISTYLTKSGYTVQLVTCNTNKAASHEIMDGLEIWRLPCWNALSGTYPIPLPLPGTIRIAASLFRQKPDVVFTYGRFYFSALLGYVFSKTRQVPLIHSEFVSSHSLTASRFVNMVSKMYDHSVGAIVVGGADRLTGNCRATGRLLEHLGGKNIVIICPPSKLDLTVFRKRETQLKDTMGFRGKTIITCVSRLIWAKGVQDLITAFPLIEKENPQVELLVLGDGPYRAELVRLAEVNCKDRIHFLGQRKREEVAEILSFTDIFVNPSYSEGLPTTVIEAASVGLPIIATDVGGTNEVVDDGKTGLLVRPGDAAGIAKRAIELAGNPELRNQLGHAAMELIRDRFHGEDVMPLYLREIESLVKTSKSRAVRT